LPDNRNLCSFHSHCTTPFTFFFFLLIRRPPRSTLFPYTTPSDLDQRRLHRRCVLHHRPDLQLRWQHRWSLPSQSSRRRSDRVLRSEEHTSELQSRSDLVCRLLLEKKNTIQNHTTTHVSNSNLLHV